MVIDGPPTTLGSEWSEKGAAVITFRYLSECNLGPHYDSFTPILQACVIRFEPLAAPSYFNMPPGISWALEVFTFHHSPHIGDKCGLVNSPGKEMGFN